MTRVPKQIALCIVAAVIVAGAAVGGMYLYRWLRPRPDIHKLGGTILVYGIVEDDDPGHPASTDELVAALTRRLDPNGANGVTVRLAGDRRVEIAIPRTGDHEQHVDDVKSMLLYTGYLEFRIVANPEDDAAGIEAATKHLASATRDAKLRKELDERALQGKPPPSPSGKEGFASPLGRFTYSWLELGKEERYTLKLNHNIAEDPARNQLWKQAAKAREKGETVAVSELGSALLYSRPCRNRLLTEAERDRKKYDYFLLGRDPERDAATGESKAITGAFLDRVTAGKDVRDKPAVFFHLNKRGGDLFYELTSRNSPSNPDGFHRHLAIILDGQILSAPSVHSAIREGGQISGGFTERQVDQLVNILRAGSLPARLKPEPVVEMTIEPIAPKN